MGKIVIPKHSADVDEMNAVLKIHYEDKGWVKSTNYTAQLKKIIGGEQYPSSYPKKAQVPAYFGFLENKLSGSRISERRITETGIKMYEAIINDDIAERQALLMDAVEDIIFGRNNGGCVSSDSDLDAPDLAIRCILDTGYCTSHEYAHMIWSINDTGKNYYQSLREVIKARSAGGITLNKDAKQYTDWKPILALIRWGFLAKAEDAQQKVMIHPDVYKTYAERLENIKVYNVDKKGAIGVEISNEEDSVDETVFKPFAISDESANGVNNSLIKENIEEVEKQHIFTGDSVLLVDRQITRLLAYHSFLISAMKREGSNYSISLEKESPVNRAQEEVLISGLREEAEKRESSEQGNIIYEILSYKNAVDNISTLSPENKDIEPINLLLRLLIDLGHLSEPELKYIVQEMVCGRAIYSDAVKIILDGRKEHRDEYELTDSSIKYEFLDKLVNSRIVEWVQKYEKKVLVFSEKLDPKVVSEFSKLSIYAVDIQKQISVDEEEVEMPLSLKLIFADKIQADEEEVEVDINMNSNPQIVQGDYIILTNNERTKIEKYVLYQVATIVKNGNTSSLSLIKHNYINKLQEQDILKEFKEG